MSELLIDSKWGCDMVGFCFGMICLEAMWRTDWTEMRLEGRKIKEEISEKCW